MLITKPSPNSLPRISENTADGILARLNDTWGKHNMTADEASQLRRDCHQLLMCWYTHQPQIERIARERDEAEAKARKWAEAFAQRGQIIVRLSDGKLDADGNEYVKPEQEHYILGRHDG